MGLLMFATHPVYAEQYREWTDESSIDRMTNEVTGHKARIYGRRDDGTPGAFVYTCLTNPDQEWFLFIHGGITGTRDYIRLRVDDNDTHTVYIEDKDWHDSVGFQLGYAILSQIVGGNRLLVEVALYRGGLAYYSFSLNGSRSAINRARSSCGRNRVLG